MNCYVLKKILATIVIILCVMSTLNAQEKETIAVLNFEGLGVKSYEVQALTNRVRSMLAEIGHYEVVERGRMDEILDEQGFQQSGCTSEECIVEAGQMLGVKFMLAGSIGLVGSTYTIDMRIIDVESSKITGTSSYDLSGSIDAVLKVGLQRGLEELLANVSGTRISFETGYIKIISEPPQAQLIIDEIPRGKTPLSVEELPANVPINLKLKKEGYETYSDTIKIKSGGNPGKKINLKRLKGKLQIKGKPVRSVAKTSDIKLGKTPIANHELPVGKYEIIISKPAYSPIEKSIEIKANKYSTINYSLEPMPKGPAFLFSLVIPGTGQLYQRHTVKSAIFFIMASGLTYLSYDAHNNYLNHKSSWQDAKQTYNNNLTRPDLWPSQRQKVLDTYDSMKDMENQRNMYLGGLGVVWSINIIDIIF